MGGGNHHPFSLFVFERREEEDPEVRALVVPFFLFPFLDSSTQKDIYYSMCTAHPNASLSLLPRGKRIELEIDSRDTFILSNNDIEYCNILHTHRRRRQRT